jgi:iron complex transport system ATP-binding protein
MADIRLQDVSFGYNGSTVLRSISLDIATGERIAVLGPNGVGKTTLLKLLIGALNPGQGALWLDGKSLHRFPKRDLARRIALVPQEFVVPFAYTAREVIELGRVPYLGFLGGLRSVDRRAVERAIQWTGTGEFVGRIFNELSGGERQRVMIAMTLAQEPDVLLLDEPTQQLDISGQAEILDIVAGLNQDCGVTVIAAIHDLNLAAAYFDRLVVLHRQSIVADGPPATVLRSELLERVYGGPVKILRFHDHPNPVILPLPRHQERDGESPARAGRC